MTAQSEIPILTSTCNERGIDVARSIYLMTLSSQNLRTLWEKSRRYQNLFGFEIEGSFERFASLMISGDENHVSPTGLFWVVDDFVGLFYMTRIIPNVDALVHYIFFDRIHKGREHLIESMMSYAFKTFGFQRITVELPDYASGHAFTMIEDLGFNLEGCKQHASENKAGWHDVFLFGLTRENFINHTKASLRQDSHKLGNLWRRIVEKVERTKRIRELREGVTTNG